MTKYLRSRQLPLIPEEKRAIEEEFGEIFENEEQNFPEETSEKNDELIKGSSKEAA